MSLTTGWLRVLARDVEDACAELAAANAAGEPIPLDLTDSITRMKSAIVALEETLSET